MGGRGGVQRRRGWESLSISGNPEVTTSMNVPSLGENVTRSWHCGVNMSLKAMAMGQE